MAYETYEVVLGRVASRSLCYYGKDNGVMNAAVDALETLEENRHSSVEWHDRHGGDYGSYSVGAVIGSIGPDSAISLDRINLVPTEEHRRLAQEAFDSLPEEARAAVGTLPFGIWLVCTAY